MLAYAVIFAKIKKYNITVKNYFGTLLQKTATFETGIYVQNLLFFPINKYIILMIILFLGFLG